MSDSDALLYRIGRDPVLRTTIVAVLVLDRSPRFEEVRRRVEALARDVPRLRCRLVPAPMGWGRPRWEPQGDLDVDLHLRRMVAPPPATLRSVLDLAQVMGTVSFDPALPLWEAVVVDGLDGGQAALVIKLHHAVTDGVGGLAIALRLLDRERRPRPRADPTGGGGRGPGDDGDGPAPKGRSRLDPVRSLAGLTARAVADPTGQMVRVGRGCRSVGRLLAPAAAPLSPLLTARSVRRRFEVLDLDRRALSDATVATRTTLNDVFVTGMLLGLGRYHRVHGVGPDRLRVLMPVSVRSASHAAAGNHFVPARFALPVTGDAAQCLRRVHDIAGSWKAAPALAVSDALASALDLLPPPLVSVVWGSMLKGDDVVATNVPGPPFETYLAGARVERFYAFAPPSGAALNVALVTPADRACVGVNIDAAAVPDPSVLTQCLADGYAEVLALAGRAVQAGV